MKYKNKLKRLEKRQQDFDAGPQNISGVRGLRTTRPQGFRRPGSINK